MFISGTAGIATEGITTRRVPIVPGRIRFASGFFSGVSVTVRVLRSRTIVSDTSPVSFLLKPRLISPGEETFSPSIAVMTSPAFNPAFAAGLLSLTEVISTPPSFTPK